MSVLQMEEVLWGVGAVANAASAVLLLVLSALVVAASGRATSGHRSHHLLAAVLALTGLSHALHVGLFTLHVAHVPWMLATVGLDLTCALAVGACLVSHVRGGRSCLGLEEGVLRSNDRVVQRLTEAGLALELGQHDVLTACIGDGLREAKAVSEDLMRLRRVT